MNIDMRSEEDVKQQPQPWDTGVNFRSLNVHVDPNTGGGEMYADGALTSFAAGDKAGIMVGFILSQPYMSCMNVTSFISCCGASAGILCSGLPAHGI